MAHDPTAADEPEEQTPAPQHGHPAPAGGNAIDRLADLDDRLAGHFADDMPADDADESPPDGLEAILLLRQVAADEQSAKPPEGGRLPRRIGRYVIMREVGRGGFARVFDAFDTRLMRRVALKVARPETLLAPGARRRFIREAELAARLDHPHVVTIHDAGEADGAVFIAEELCAGGSLAEWLERHPRPLPPRDAARVVAALAGAVVHSHGFCVLHRDIKPGNVLLVPAPDGPLGSAGIRCDVKLGDFGLGKLADGGRPAQATELTSAGMRIGTPAWMAPEQVDGSLGPVGPATDIHGLGLILDRLLTGRTQFAGPDDAAALRAVLTADPVSPDRIVHAVPADLAAVTLKCLARNPLERYPTVVDLAGDLARFLAGLPTIARPLGPLTRGARWLRRHRIAAAACAVAAFTSLLALTAGVLQVEQRRALAARGAEIRSHQAAATLRRGFESWRSGDVTGAMSQIAACRALDPALADSLATRMLLTRLHGEDAVLLAAARSAPETATPGDPPRDLYTIAVSPDGSMVATGGADGLLRCVSLAGDGLPTGMPREVPFDGEIADVAFAPDGTKIAVAGEAGRLCIFDAATGTIRHAWRFPEGTLCAVAWSADGTRLACGGAGRMVRLLDAEGAREPMAIFRPFDPLESRMSADAVVEAIAFVAGDRIAASCGSQVAIQDLTDAQGVRRLDVDGGTVSHLAASPDGRRLISGGTDRTPRIWDVETGAPVSALPMHPSWVAGCALADDGRAVTACRDGIVRVYALDGAAIASPCVGHEGRVWDVAILPGGDVVSAGRDGTVRRWHPRRSDEFAGWKETPVAWPGGVAHAIPTGRGGVADEWLVVVRSPEAIGVVDDRGRWSRSPEPTEVRNDLLLDDQGVRLAATDDRYQIFTAPMPGGGGRVSPAPGAIANGRLAWSGTAGLLIGTRPGTIAHWDGVGDDYTVIDRIDAQPDAVAVTFAGEPRALVIAGKLVRLYTLAADGRPRPRSGRTLLTLPDTMGRGIIAAWAPDGSSFVIGTNEGTVDRFDAASGQSLGVFAKHPGPIRALAWSPDGRTLMTADATCVRFSDDRTTTVFDEFRPGWVIESVRLGLVEGPVDSIVVAGNLTADDGPVGPGRIAVARLAPAVVR